MATDEDGGTAGRRSDPQAKDPDARIAALERDLARIERMQQHQRAQYLSVHGGLVQMHASLQGQVRADLPETLRPVAFFENEREDILFLAFAGLNLGLGIPPFEFRRTLAEHQAPGYFIKDFHQAWYQQGLLGLTSDLASTRDYLQDLVSAHGARTLVTLGVSTGAYAAILFGCWLGAQRVLAFSPQTDINKRVTARFAQLDTPPDFLQRGDPLPDLQQVVAQSAAKPDIRIYYGAEHRHDVRQASRLRGLEGVTLIPVPDAQGHSMPAELRRRGELGDILAAFLQPAG